MKKLLLLTTTLVCLSAPAQTCPWQVGADITKSYTEEKNLIPLTQIDIQEDLDCLKILLNNVYIANSLHPNARVIEKLEELKNSVVAKTNKELLPDLLNIHRDLIDMHLSYSLDHATAKFEPSNVPYGLEWLFEKKENAYVATINGKVESLSHCEGLDAVKVSEQPERYVFRLKLGENPNQPFRCQAADKKSYLFSNAYPISAFLVNQPATDADKIYLLTDDIVYLRPGKLGPMTKEQNDVIEYIKGHDTKLVIDLMEHPGGSIKYPEKIATAIYAKEQTLPGYYFITLKSKIQTIGTLQTDLFLKKDVTAKAEQVKGYESLPLNDLLDKTVVDWVYYSPEGTRSKPYQNKIIILTSNKCSSACEKIIELLSPLENVTVIGQSTKGATKYYNPAQYILPNSKIKVYIPTGANDYENAADEGFGYAVDIKLDVIDLSNPQKLFELAPQKLSSMQTRSFVTKNLK